MYERILLPTDGSSASEAAVDHAIALARRFDAALDVLYVDDESGVPLDRHSRTLVEATRQEGRASVEEIAQRAAECGVHSVGGTVRTGVPHEVVADHVDECDCDLVVMGTHRRAGLDRLLHGSVTDRVLRRVDVPVVAVPPPGHDGHRASRR